MSSIGISLLTMSLLSRTMTRILSSVTDADSRCTVHKKFWSSVKGGLKPAGRTAGSFWPVLRPWTWRLALSCKDLRFGDFAIGDDSLRSSEAVTFVLGALKST